MKFNFNLLPILIALAFTSCKTQPTAPGTATIRGHAWFADYYAHYVPPFSGITVTLDGTNISAVTDDSGAYELDNVPAGTYNVRFTKPGYGEVRWFGKSVQGGGNAPIYWDNPTEPQEEYFIPTLLRQPDFVVTLRSLRIVDTVTGDLPVQDIIAQGTYTGNFPTEFADIAIYFSKSPTVSSLPRYYSIYYCFDTFDPSLCAVDTISKTFSIHFDAGNVTPFLGTTYTGDTIYAATYGAPFYGISPPNDYFDPGIDNYVLTALNQTASPVIGARIP